MNQQPKSAKVPLVTLKRKVAASGSTYWSGWMGESRAVGWDAVDEEDGSEVIRVFLCEVVRSPQRALPLPSRRPRGCGATEPHELAAE